MDMGACIQQAIAHARSGRVTEAITLMQSACAAHPTSAQGHGLLGSLLMSVGRPADSLAPLRRAHELGPNEAHIAFQLGAALVALERPLEGLPFMQRAVDLNPAWLPGLLGFARALQGVGDFDRSESVYRRAIGIDPRSAEAQGALGGMLIVSGRIAEAVDLFRKAARDHPEDPSTQSKLLSALNYAADATPEEVLEAHRRWGQLIMRDAGAENASDNSRDPNKRLRVGLLSTDLWDHSCAYFLRPLLTARDPSRIEFICYSTAVRSDWMTEELRAAADAWHSVAGLDDRALVDRLRADHLDIAIELNGHTAQGPLAALRRRAAPVQATYLGYPNTTGLPTIDWRLVDEVTDPPGTERWCTERLARIEGCFLCYSGSRASAATEGPARPPWRPITFGSFNSIRKLSAEVIKVWARVLNATPGSSLLVKTQGIGTPAARRTFQSAFADAGIDPSRVELHPGNPDKREHLGEYRRIDIALDTFPYNGTTTTCEAMWAGVPVIALEGTMHAGRVGMSLLKAVGLPDLIARTPDDFVVIASKLAADRGRLDSLHAGLHDQMSRSLLCDGPGFARRFESALRTMWQNWCGS